MSLLYQYFLHLNFPSIPGWQKTIVALLVGELRLVCTCSSATNSHTSASVKHWVRGGSMAAGLCVHTNRHSPSMTSACIEVLTACVTAAMVHPHRWEKNRITECGLWNRKKRKKKEKVCNVEQRDRAGGVRERMEVDGETLNHWWRSNRIH